MAMKIYLLLLLIGTIVGLSHFPVRRRSEQTAPVRRTRGQPDA
jgi:hypothetical protein